MATSTPHGSAAGYPPTYETIEDIFEALVSCALEQGLYVLRTKGQHFTIATMCSGTDAPIIACREIRDAAASLGFDSLLSFTHIFSVEIETYKQAFIRRNARPEGPIFRDVEEVARGDTAMTAEGFEKPVPGDIDLLVVGSSCVDFSSLKTTKARSMGDSLRRAGSSLASEDYKIDHPGYDDELEKLEGTGGESTRTFVACLRYILKHRPKVVILENVLHAPWDDISQYFFPKANYAASYVKLNSRDYGIPHTRLRGYLVAFDFKVFGKAAQDMANTWAQAMPLLTLGEPAPLHNFVLPWDHRKIAEARIAVDSLDSRPRVHDAPMSMMRHDEARKLEGLPPGNPYTLLDERENCTPMEITWAEYIRSLGARVQDLLDIQFLRGLKDGYDMTHKMLIFDVSQNVDRSPGQLGTSPCITPKGMPFLTISGRPVIGHELLALQGIAPEKIVPSIESSAQLQDLAGNAMTTTVVGAAILSVFIALIREEAAISNGAFTTPAVSYITFYLENSLRPTLHWNRQPVAWTACPPEVAEASTAMDLSKTSTSDLLMIHEVGRSYCPCDGIGTRDRSQQLYTCLDCGEIRCRTCKGNPSHNFRKLHLGAKKFLDRPEAERRLKDLFPSRFLLITSGKQPPDEESRPPCTLWVPEQGAFATATRGKNSKIDQAMQMCCDEVQYFFRSIHIGQVITIHYESKYSRVQVVLSSTCVTWKVFLKPAAAVELKLENVGDWRYPILKAVLLGGNRKPLPRSNDWQLFTYSPIRINVNERLLGESGSPEMELEIESTVGADGSNLRLTDPVVDFLLRNQIGGRYRFTQNCGVSRRLLYYRFHDEMKGERPVYIFEDPESATKPEKDVFVVASTNRRLHTFERREVICKFPEGYTPGTTQRVQCVCEGWWVPARQDIVPERDVGGIDHDNIVLGAGLRYSSNGQDCASPFPVIQINMPLHGIPWSRDLYERIHSYSGDLFQNCSVPDSMGELWLPVLPQHENDILAIISPFMKQVSTKQLEEVASEGIRLDGDPGVCMQCVPTPPHVHRIRDSGGKIIHLISDPTQCHAFEDRVQGRPRPLEIQIRRVQLSRGGNPEADHRLEARIFVNLPTLAHRAYGYFDFEQANVRTRELGGVRLLGNVELRYVNSFPRRLPSFYSVLRPVHTTDLALSASPTPSFILNGKALRPDQLVSMLWMLERERSPKPFVEREVEEYVSEPLGIRLTGSAEVGHMSRSGILAHDIGYGKTVVTLGLIDSQRGRFEEQSLSERKVRAAGLRHLKATLIIVPLHIVGQWRQEAERFLQNNERPWVIVTFTSLRDVSQDALATADIIIIGFNVLKMKQPVRDRLAAVSGQLRMGEKENGRNLAEWYRSVLEQIPKVQDDYWGRDGFHKEGLDSEILMDVKERHQEMADLYNKQVLPSSRKKRAASSSVRNEKLLPTDSPVTWNLQNKKDPARPSNIFEEGTLLQLYSFSRIIFDEFSYNEEEVAIFVNGVVATCKWILSGTPPLSNLGQVCSIANLINIHVARPEPALPPHLPKITHGPETKSLTSSENFRAYRELKESRFAMERHDQGQRFVQHFFRRNPTVQGDYKVIEKVIICRLDTLGSAFYSLLQQELFDAKWSIDNLHGDLRRLVMDLVQKEQRSGHSRAIVVSKNKSASSIRVLLLAASLNLYSDFAPASRANSGHTVLSVLDGFESAAKTKVNRLYKLIKSQFDRMMYLTDRVMTDPTFNYQQARPQDARRKKVENALAYVDAIVGQLINTKASELGGLEILKLLRQAVLGLPVGNFHFHNREGSWEPCSWQSWKGGPGEYHIIDWYPWVPQDLDALSKEELQEVHMDLQHIVAGAPKDSSSTPRNNRRKPLSKAALKAAISTLSAKAVEKRKLQAQSDDMEASCGFEADSQGNMSLCRSIGLKCAESGGIGSSAEERLQDHRAKKSKDDAFEFGVELPSQYPVYGESKQTRGTTIDATLDDLIKTVQSLRQAVYKTFPQTYHKFRFMRNLADLLKNAPNGAWCSYCGPSATEMEKSMAFSTCKLAACEDCLNRVVRRGRKPPILFGTTQPAAPNNCICATMAYYMCPDELKHYARVGDHLWGKSKQPRLCDACQRNDIEDLSQAFMLVTCGHVLCSECAQEFNASQDRACRANDCSCKSTRAMVRCDRLLTTSSHSKATRDGLSPKLAKLVEIVHEIITKGEKVLVFTQFNLVKEQIAAIFREDPSISFTRTDGPDAVTRLAEFQDGRYDVLLQSLLSSESAGSNLTIANHIIFAGPLDADAENYAMYLRQAKGRCSRMGQTRDVHVYHLVTEYTMDVDVLEQHEGLVLIEGDEILLNVDQQPVESEPLGRGMSGEASTSAEADEEKRIRSMFDEREIRKLLGKPDDKDFEGL